jgi:hypothetical protein
MREKITDLRPIYEQAEIDQKFTTIIAEIGNTAFEEAYKEGSNMTIDEAVALVLQEF